MEREIDKDTILKSNIDNSPERQRKNKKEKKSKKSKHRSSSRDDDRERKKESKRNRSPSSIDLRKINKEKKQNGDKESVERKNDKYLNKYKHKDTEAGDSKHKKDQKSHKNEKYELDNDETTIKETKSDNKKNDKLRERSRQNSREKHKKRSKSRERSNQKRRGSRSKSRNRSRSRDRRREHSRKRDKKHRRSLSRERDRERSRERDRDRSRERDRDRRSRSRHRSRSKYNKKSRSNDRGVLGEKLPILDIKNKFEEIARFTSENAPISTSDISKRDRELYVANLPKGLTPKDVIELLNSALVAIEANLKAGDPILSAWINPDQNYALLEFRDSKEAQNAFKLNGLKLIDKEIKIGKPRYEGENINQQIKDMFPTLTGFEKDLNNPVLNRSITSGTSYSNAALPYSTHSVTQTVLPTCSKLLVSNLPLDFDEESVYKVLKIYGPIKSLEMIKDPITGNYSGQCHVEYENEKATSKALHYAMGINLKGNILYIKRSSGLVPTYSVSGGSAPTSLGILTNGLGAAPQQQYMTAEDYVKFRENTSSQVICIRNMVNLKDLDDDDEYDDLIEDVREECKIYGKVLDVKIPRPETPGEIVPGLGKIFVEYATRDGASFAKENLNGKSFHGRFVEVVFHPEEMYRKNQLD